MGQIFTWKDIKRSRVPKIDSFYVVAEMMKETLNKETSIVSALLFGSVVRGDFNIRSDIDCVVIYETENENDAVDTMHRIDIAAKRLFVPINFTPCDTVLAKTRLHRLGSSFLTHLEASMKQGGLIKGNLFELLASTISAREEIESYIAAKMFSIVESYAELKSLAQERYVSFLKKAYESPTHVARKMLMNNGKLRGDSKKEVQSQYRKVISNDLAAKFDYLLNCDWQYTQALKEQMRELNLETYLLIMRQLENELPKVLDFLRSNILLLNQAARYE